LATVAVNFTAVLAKSDWLATCTEYLIAPVGADQVSTGFVDPVGTDPRTGAAGAALAGVAMARPPASTTATIVIKALKRRRMV
jgi:hypothetical protein